MPKELKPESQNYYKSISRAAKILTCLSESKNTVTEVARACEITKPTVSRLLKALEKSNLTIYDPIHHKYFLGPLLGRLQVNSTAVHRNLIESSTHEMNRLSEICGETIGLGILVGIQHVRLHVIPSRYDIGYNESNGNFSIIQKFEGAATKVLLSQLAEQELTLVTNHIELKKLRDNSVFEKEKFHLELGQIKKQGYAISHGEKLYGALGISALIKGYQFPACLSIIGVESRLENKLNKVIAEITNSANIISGNIKNLSNFLP